MMEIKKKDRGRQVNNTLDEDLWVKLIEMAAFYECSKNEVVRQGLKLMYKEMIARQQWSQSRKQK